jgi:hypothetical protein
VNTLEFLKKVCPKKDKIVVTQYNHVKDKFWNREVYSYQELERAAEDIQRWDQQKDVTIYFSIGAFTNNIEVGPDGRQKIRRTQQAASCFRVLCFDLDCGDDKPYKTLQEGLMALVNMVKAVELPKPMVIKSGNGAHVYWTLSETIEKDKWVTLSSALFEATQSHGLEIDASKIKDPSMVLRPVGSFHKKAEWKPVEMLIEGAGEQDVGLMAGLLKDYMPKAKPVKAKKQSALLDAVLGDTKNIDLDSLAEKCQQVRALMESGGVTNAAGDPVDEPMWRASLGIAKFTPDEEVSVVLLAGGHPDFDFDANMEKLAGWKGTGPTNCKTFEDLCPKGCDGCPYRGGITSPAQLSGMSTEIVEEVVDQVTQEVIKITFDMPEGYVVKDDCILKEKKVETEHGIATEWERVSTYQMYIRSIFFDPLALQTSIKVAIKYPIRGWEEHEFPVEVLSSLGKEFSSFLLNTQVFGFKTTPQQEKLRGYLMDYLEMVQQRVATGYDYASFGWQKDGSFICGNVIVNAPNGTTDRRITGSAKDYLERIQQVGTREGFVAAMDMLNNPGTRVIRICVLAAMSGLLAKHYGNGSSIISIYSTQTTTGKTLSLLAVNSLFGHPKDMIQGRNDTPNYLYSARGTLNNLPMTIDELTMADDYTVATMAYSFSEGKEKSTLTSDRRMRKPATWDGPTFMTTNTSLMEKFAGVQQDSEPLRVRTFEIRQDDRTFVSLKTSEGESLAREFGDKLIENYGWAMPELAEAICSMGGAEKVAESGRKDFRKNFDFEFDPQERFYEAMIMASWAVGKMAKALGLITFDVKQTIAEMLECVESLRVETKESKVDALDVVSLFMQQNNDKIITVTKRYGAGNKAQVQHPVPATGVMRAEFVYDENNPIMPGSTIALNKSAFRKFLKDNNDAEDRVVRELHDMGALVDRNSRVTLYKGCGGVSNPGQTYCIIVNLNHPRFVDAIAGTSVKKQSNLSLAVLQGLQGDSNA